MKQLTVNAYAKINLSLDVLGRRADGYHDVCMIMQSVSLCDKVTLSQNEGGISIASSLPYLPCDGRNLAYRAAECFFKEANIPPATHIYLEKNIPVGAGLAGGSTDCAAVLSGLNELYGHPLSKETLLSIGASLGADVPFCLLGGTMLSEGIGEILTPLPPMPQCGILLVKPRFSVSTKGVYEAIDSCTSLTHPDTQSLIDAIKNENLPFLASNLCNMMEAVTAEKHPVIRTIIKKLKDLGALGAAMSGSGPTVFGLFENKASAIEAGKALSSSPHEIFVATPV